MILPSWWQLVEWAFRAHFVAFGVAVTVAAWERWLNGGNWIVSGGLSYLLAVSWFTFAYVWLRPAQPAQPAPKLPIYLPPAPRTLPRLEDTQPTRPRFESIAPKLESDWDWLGFQPRMVDNLRTCLREFGRFSWRTRPVGMNHNQYMRTRLFLLTRGWGYERRGGVELTEAGRAAVGMPSPAEFANS